MNYENKIHLAFHNKTRNKNIFKKIKKQYEFERECLKLFYTKTYAKESFNWKKAFGGSVPKWNKI